jgi:hypothetical protein
MDIFVSLQFFIFYCERIDKGMNWKHCRRYGNFSHDSITLEDI